MRGAAKGWRPRERAMAAAMLDVLGAPVAFERLVTDWELDPKDATTAITWTIGISQRTLSEGPKPG